MVTSAPIDIDKVSANTATSLGDELMCALDTDMNASGNSLVGRAWTIPYHAQQTTQTVLSSPAVSEPDSPMANFDSVLRSALLTAIDGGDEQIEETRVDHRDEEGNGFLATVNSKSEQISSVIEVAQCSLPESADDAACSAARTRLPIETTSTIPEDDAEAEIIQTDTVNGLDECGVPEHIVEMLSLIQQEKGLDEQGFRCPSCRRSIGLGFGQFRVCAFDARYYCTDCWKKGSTVPIPSRLLHGWDVSPRQVARPSRELLNNVADRPLIRVDVVNPTLYDHCLPMRQIKEQREKLSLVALYLLSCRQSIADDLRRRLWPKEYLYTDVHLYSVSDLYDAVSGQLLRHVQNLVNFAVSHVHGCALCAQKGFICELCHSQQIIYPFQVETTSRCLECFSVFHTECLTGRECPKCVRRRVYEKTGKEEEEGRHLMLD